MRFQRVQTSGLIRDGGTCGLVGENRSRSEALPRFYDQLEPSYQVTLGLGVRQQIANELGAMRSEFAVPLETGGFLLSNPDSHDWLRVATQPGDRARFARSSVELDIDHAIEITETYPHLELRGDWHFEPDGDGIPSVTDRRAWATGARSITRDYWIGVIVTPPASMFAEPQLHGWYTCDAWCEPLRLVVS